MKIGLYDPYLETLGGGEKYFLTVLETAVKTPGVEVTLFAPTHPDTRQWKRLGIQVPQTSFSFKKTDELTLARHSQGLDRLFVMHNGIPPESRAKRSIAMIQFPFQQLSLSRKRDWLRPVQSTWQRVKQLHQLRSYDTFLCNSKFTEEWLVKRFGVSPLIAPPP